MTENSIQVIRKYALSPEVVSRFRDVSGHNAMEYISSALMAVSNSNTLQECTPVSIMSSALRAATLQLSCDPAMGQAWLIPFKNKCTLIVGYKGLIDMALRTGKYRHLNVAKVYEGESVVEDRIKGIHSLAGSPTSEKVIGYMLYFELLSGYSKTVYMTVEELKQHALDYSKGISRDDSLWKTNFDAMAKKTLVRIGLTKWGYLNPYDQAVFTNDTVEDLYDMPVNVTITEPEPITAQQATEDLYGDDMPCHKTTDRKGQADTLLDEVTELGGEVKSQMNLETALNIKNAGGIKYGEIDTENLGYMKTSIQKVLDKKTLSQDDTLEHLLKRDAINLILESRKTSVK